jgi:hypothetical protein
MSDVDDWMSGVWTTLDAAWTGEWFGLQTPPRQIYHYTDAAGLLGILQTKSIWATDAHCLNDAQELRYGTQLAIAYARSVLKATDSSVVREYLKRSIRSWSHRWSLRKASGEWSGRAMGSMYLASFCEDGDLLSQWRGYAGVTGYSIGLATEWWDLTAMPQPLRIPALRLRRVLYSEEDQHKAFGPLLQAACRSLEDAAHRFGDAAALSTFEPRLQEYVGWALYGMAPCFKHPGFEEEREWRLVCVVGADDPDHGSLNLPLRFRHAAIGIVPYVIVPMAVADGPYQSRLPITEVYHGPSDHADVAEAVLLRLLKEHGYAVPHTKVKAARAPLRV